MEMEGGLCEETHLNHMLPSDFSVPCRGGQLYVKKAKACSQHVAAQCSLHQGTLMSVSYRAAHGWVYAGKLGSVKAFSALFVSRPQELFADLELNPTTQ